MRADQKARRRENKHILIFNCNKKAGRREQGRTNHLKSRNKKGKEGFVNCEPFSAFLANRNDPKKAGQICFLRSWWVSMTLRLNLILLVERLILWAENKNADPVWGMREETLIAIIGIRWRRQVLK